MTKEAISTSVMWNVTIHIQWWTLIIAIPVSLWALPKEQLASSCPYHIKQCKVAQQPVTMGLQFQGNITHFMKILKRKSITAFISLNLFYCFFSIQKAVQCKLVGHAPFCEAQWVTTLFLQVKMSATKCIYFLLYEQT